MLLNFLRASFPYAICMFLFGAFTSTLLGLAGSVVIFIQVTSAAIAGINALLVFNKYAYQYYLISAIFLLILAAAYILTFLNVNSSVDVNKFFMLSAILLFSSVVGVYLAFYREMDRLVTLIAYFSLAITFGLYFLKYDGGDGRLGQGSSNPIWVARAAGIFVIYALICAFYERSDVLKVFLAFAAFGVLLLTGSRGPLLSLVVVSLAFTMFYPKGGVRKLFIVGVAVVLGLVIFISLPDSISNRLLGGGATGRAYLYYTALELFKSNILGWGMGGFAAQTNLPESLSYPHNIILEYLVEAGLVYTLLFASIILCSLYCSLALVRQSHSKVHGVLAGVFWFSLCNAMFSGDMTTPKEMYLLSVYFLCEHYRVRKLKFRSVSFLERGGINYNVVV